MLLEKISYNLCYSSGIFEVFFPVQGLIRETVLFWDYDNAPTAQTCWAISLPSETRKLKDREAVASLKLRDRGQGASDKVKAAV